MRRLLLDVRAGRVLYEEALAWQRLLVDARVEDAIDDVLLILEHDPVYTAGRRADVARNVLGTTPIRVVRVDRGGDVTYHGPGQLVAYPIVRLEHPKAVHAYVTALEEVCVRTAASYGIEATRSAGRPGVWVGNDKLAAVGVRVDRGVTMHGLAFNVQPDLSHFAGVVACGLHDAGVCSLASLGVDTTLGETANRVAAHLADLLGRRLQPARPADLGLTAVRAAG